VLEVLQGNIKATSALGVGSRFLLRVPVTTLSAYKAADVTPPVPPFPKERNALFWIFSPLIDKRGRGSNEM
jgi:hypothetical protein